MSIQDVAPVPPNLDEGDEPPPPPPPSGSMTAQSLLIKIILVGLVDALLIAAIARAAQAEWWLAVGFFVVALIAVNLVYFSGRALPFKYLLPGVLFLIVFQLYTMAYTGYASFTNYGSGHLGDKASAIETIERTSISPVEGAPTFALVPVARDGEVAMLVTDPESGEVSIGTNDGLSPVAEGDVQRDGDTVTGVAGYETLDLATLAARYQDDWVDLRPPIDEEAGTFLRASSFSVATLSQPGYRFDEDQDAMVSALTGDVFPSNGDIGNFEGADDIRLQPGWRVGVGFDNFSSLLSDETLRSRFVPILIWTFLFSIISTVLNFSLGLALALVLRERRMRGKGIYRLLLIIPYGLPGILTILVWKGMLDTDFGLVNQLFGTDIGWLTSSNLARFSVLMVNLWLGFPYFFLVASGALTAVPEDLKEAAFVDGASGRYAFRTVVLPLLLVATAPLLVTTFAFNFNNYALIELLTQGGPFGGSFLEGGDTDLLINFTFRKAFNESNQQLGLASAIALVIFVFVGTISAYGFRLTKRLEEIGG